MATLPDDFVENANLKAGMLILLKNHPCNISHLACSHGGKHGTQKIWIVGNDIFTGMKYEDIFPIRGHITELIKTNISTYLATNLNGNTLHALDEKYNQEIQIDLASKNLCMDLMIYLKNMKACTVKILSYQNLHKIIEINTP